MRGAVRAPAVVIKTHIYHRCDDTPDPETARYRKTNVTASAAAPSSRNARPDAGGAPPPRPIHTSRLDAFFGRVAPRVLRHLVEGLAADAGLLSKILGREGVDVVGVLADQGLGVVLQNTGQLRLDDDLPGAEYAVHLHCVCRERELPRRMRRPRRRGSTGWLLVPHASIRAQRGSFGRQCGGPLWFCLGLPALVGASAAAGAPACAAGRSVGHTKRECPADRGVLENPTEKN